jgi:hypothetical protein
MSAGESVEDLIKRTKKISRTELRAKTSGGGRSTKYAKFKKMARSLEPGGDGAELNRLTESQVSSIRTQINHLNPDDADDDEKQFVATRRKMTTDGGEDITDDEGNQLYDLFISREEVDEESEAGKQISEKPTETKSSQNGQNAEEEEESSPVEEDWEEMFE